jgi:hypothetical protein
VGEKRAGISYAGLAHGREKGRGWWAAADAFRARGMSAADQGDLHLWLLEMQSRSLGLRPCQLLLDLTPGDAHDVNGVADHCEALREVGMRTVVELWRGDLPLGRALWLWGVLGGDVIALFATLLALTLVTAGAPAWLAALAFAGHVPWNLVLLVGVWRSAGRSGVGVATALLARLAIAA